MKITLCQIDKKYKIYKDIKISLKSELRVQKRRIML